jgi:hypothetical protein
MNFASTLDETTRSDLLHWIAVIAQPDDRLGGSAVCPFAHLARNTMIVRADGEIVPPAIPFDVVIYVLPDQVEMAELDRSCRTLNATYPDLVFLADSRDRITDINGAITSNGAYNLILCQPKEKLRAARYALAKTRYYQYWDSMYLREILGDDYAEIVGHVRSDEG